MTYIEFFDTFSSKNICACLTRTPKRVVLIGNKTKQINRYITYYKKVFEARGLDIAFEAKSVPRTSLSSAVNMLTQLVEKYDNCVFDITGGEEILLVALGVVYHRYPEKNIQIHSFNLENNMLYDCDEDGVTIYEQAPSLTVEEQVRIYGGDVVYGSVWENKTYRWDLHPGFVRDMDAMWELCRYEPWRWNAQLLLFAAAEKVGTVSEDGLTTRVLRAELSEQLAKDGGTYALYNGLTGRMLRSGLLTKLQETEEALVIGYKNPQVKRCMTKAGQILELRTFLAAQETRDKNGNPVYHDAVNGVLIDWDGAEHDEQREHVFDTENEIDVMMMHHMVPVFVSCKNGIVKKEELYKFNTVALRFGGKLAKKVLVASEPLQEKAPSLCQRMRDMDIQLIDNVKAMDFEELQRRLRAFF